MKYFIVLAFVCCVIELSECMTKERQVELFISLSKDCKKREGATDDDLAAMMAGQASRSHGAKCIQACMGERTALMKYNKILPEGAAFVVGVVLDEDDPRIEQARKMANACIDVTDDDRCEAAFKIVECAHKFATDNGYDVRLV